MAVQIDKEKVFYEIMFKAAKTPGVKINRSKFLRKELKKYCSEKTIQEAIDANPAKAGIEKELINRISLSVINFESTKVTGISAAASLPGGVWGVAAATGDIVSYFAFILRVVQELAYLYGFDDFELDENEIDSDTLNTMLIFLGAMFGVQQATVLLKALSNSLAKQVGKNLAKKALTKTVYYPIIKQVAKKVGIRMTKQIFADTVSSAIPVVGAVLSGGLTFVMFKPNCMKLRKKLMTYNLCDPEFYKSNEYYEANGEVVVDFKDYE